MRGAEEIEERAETAMGAGSVFGGKLNYRLTGQAAADSGPQRSVGVIEVRLHELIAARGMTLAELSQRVGVTVVNLSILKNGHARAIRFSTLVRLCEALDCQPGDLLAWHAGTNGSPSGSAAEAETPGSGAKAR